MSSNDKSSQINIGHPKFVSEQSGPFEDQLKEHLRLLFDQAGCVARAYLLRVIFEGGFDQGVVLGLSADGTNTARIVSQIGEIFAGLFSGDQCLDIVLLDDDSEKDATAVCRPFYVKSPSRYVRS